MANLAKLREKARALEGRGRWNDALRTYQEIVANSEAGGVDAGTWNRIGDLHLRLDQTDQAVRAYEQGVAEYENAGLHDSAVALCRKILRAAPARVEVHRTLGRISAAQGFIADARQNFLNYAEQMRQAGRDHDALDALREFAEIAPDDLEVRRLISAI